MSIEELKEELPCELIFYDSYHPFSLSPFDYSNAHQSVSHLSVHQTGVRERERETSERICKRLFNPQKRVKHTQGKRSNQSDFSLVEMEKLKVNLKIDFGSNSSLSFACKWISIMTFLNCSCINE
jgi:hypothetical protein